MIDIWVSLYDGENDKDLGVHKFVECPRPGDSAVVWADGEMTVIEVASSTIAQGLSRVAAQKANRISWLGRSEELGSPLLSLKLSPFLIKIRPAQYRPAIGQCLERSAVAGR